MMHLNIIYRANQAAHTILAYLEREWDEVYRREFQIEGQTYWEISSNYRNPQPKLVINQLQAVLNSLNDHTTREILGFNGIVCLDPEGEMVNRSYEVLIYNMSIISIKQSSHTKTALSSKNIKEDQCKKIAEISKRVLYLLGLDYGMVKLVVTGKKKIKVAEIEASPDTGEKDTGIFIQYLDKLLNFKSCDLYDVKLGADPEFMIKNTRNGKMVAASDFFPREGIVGCDAIRTRSRQQRPIGEVRPQPEYSPLALLANIKEALQRANKQVPYRNLALLAGSQPFNGYSIGGHIHFSNLNLSYRVLRALDNYLGIPIFLIEEQETAVRRRKKYGFLADYRVKDYGGFEYRTPGSWLVSEEIATAVLCLAKIVTGNILHLNSNIFLDPEAHAAFYQGNQEYFKKYFWALWSDITCLEMYRLYQDELDIIPDMIEKGIPWNEKVDIRKAWGLKNSTSRSLSRTSHSRGSRSQIISSSVRSSPGSNTRRSTFNSNRRFNTMGYNSTSSNYNRDQWFTTPYRAVSPDPVYT